MKRLIKIFPIFLLIALSVLSFLACDRSGKYTISKINVYDGFRTEYFLGEECIVSGQLKVTYQDEHYDIVDITEDMVEGLSTSTIGINAVTIKYKNASVKVDVAVNAVEVSELSFVEGSMPVKGYQYYSFPAGGQLEVTYNNGFETVVPVKANNISGYNNKILGEQEITVGYGGKLLLYTIEVVADSPASITVLALKSEYLLNEGLSCENSRLSVVNLSGKRTEEVITANMITGFTTAHGGDALITISFAGLSVQYKITVLRTLVSISYKEGSLPNEFDLGAEFPSAGVFQKLYDDGSIDEIAITEGMFGETFSAQEPGEFSVDITYETCVYHYSYKVLKDVSQVLFAGYTKYVLVGTEFDGKGELSVIYADGSREAPPLTDSKISMHGYNTSEAGQHTVIIEYRGVQSSFALEVYDEEDKFAINSIMVESAFWPSYVLSGEQLNISEAQLTVEYKYMSSITVAVTADMLDCISWEESGQKSVTVTYGGAQTTAEINVITQEYATTPTMITVNSWTKTLYGIGEGLDFSGARLFVVYGGGYSAGFVPVEAAMVSGYNAEVSGEQVLTVTYGAVSCAQKVYVVSELQKTQITSIAVEGWSTVNVYTDSQLSELDLSGVNVCVTYGYGWSTECVALTAEMISGYVAEEAVGYRNINVTYLSNVCELRIYVYDKAVKTQITGIEIVGSDNLYYYGEELRLSNITLRVTYGYGYTSEMIRLDKVGVTVSGYDSMAIGSQFVEVFYAEKHCTMVVTVQYMEGSSVVGSISVKGGAKSAYAIDDELDTDMVLIVRYEDGSEEITVTADMVSGFNTSVAGNYIMTIVYGGYACVLAYTVA